MKQILFACLVVLLSAGSLLAHHSFANFDTTTAARVDAHGSTLWESPEGPGHCSASLRSDNSDQRPSVAAWP